MATLAPFNPRPLLQSLIDKNITVKLKWGGTEYTGRLVSMDLYMNIQLADAEEWTDGVMEGLGQILIRCNNVLWIGQTSQVEKQKVTAQRDTIQQSSRKAHTAAKREMKKQLQLGA